MPTKTTQEYKRTFVFLYIKTSLITTGSIFFICLFFIPVSCESTTPDPIGDKYEIEISSDIPCWIYIHSSQTFQGHYIESTHNTAVYSLTPIEVYCSSVKSTTSKVFDVPCSIKINTPDSVYRDQSHIQIENNT
ncbi:MAG: hypothetical protein OCD76_19455 [Reichenbachiella sp.]